MKLTAERFSLLLYFYRLDDRPCQRGRTTRTYTRVRHTWKKTRSMHSQVTSLHFRSKNRGREIRLGRARGNASSLNFKAICFATPLCIKYLLVCCATKNYYRKKEKSVNRWPRRWCRLSRPINGGKTLCFSSWKVGQSFLFCTKFEDEKYTDEWSYIIVCFEVRF